MVTMRVNQPGIQRLKTLTQALQLDDADKSGPLLIEMDRVHSRQARRAFTTQGGSAGSVWAPLSPRYREWKKKARPGRRILVFDGDMRDRYTMPSNANHIREFVRPFTYRFGVASEKAWRHETGTGVGKQRLPRRSVLHKTSDDIRQFRAALLLFYRKRIRQVTRHL